MSFVVNEHASEVVITAINQEPLRPVTGKRRAELMGGALR